jgi:hypothetical protein
MRKILALTGSILLFLVTNANAKNCDENASISAERISVKKANASACKNCGVQTTLARDHIKK